MADSKLRRQHFNLPDIPDPLLRRYWTELLAALSSEPIREIIANQLFQREAIHQQELEVILQAGRKAPQELLLILSRRSRNTIIGFANILQGTQVKDIQALGRVLLQEAGEIERSEDKVVRKQPNENADLSRLLLVKRSIEAGAYYHLCSTAGHKLEFGSKMPVSWRRSEVTLLAKFKFPGSTTATVVDNNLLVARRGDSTIYMINLESGDSQNLTTEKRPWVIMQLFRMKNKCLALVKAHDGCLIVCYEGTTSYLVCRVPDTDGLSEMSAVASDTDIYVIGGMMDYSSLITGQVLRYSQGQWETITEMPIPRSHPTCVVIGDQLIVGGGSLGGIGKTTNVVEVFDLSTCTWTTFPPTTMKGCQLVCLAGILIATGGQTNDGVTSCHVEMLDATGCWAAMPPMMQHRICHTVCDTPDMTIVAAGGFCLHTVEIMEIAKE